MDSRIKQFIIRKVLGVATEAEEAWLAQWRQECSTNEDLYLSIADEERLKEDFKLYRELDWEKAYRRSVDGSGVGRRFILRSMKWAAIFTFVVLSGTGYYLMREATSVKPMEVVEHKSGKPKACLIRSDGSTMDLTNLPAFNFTEANSVQVKGQQGEQIVYARSAERLPLQGAELVYNTLDVSRGGEYQLQLADGTRVWLNAQSTLKYPVDFLSDKREVFLTGEAYFDVVKDGKPFLVRTAGGQVTVLGTRFNVKAYPDEASEFVTLEEGKVKVDANKGGSATILPGTQASIQKLNGRLKIRAVNTANFTGWRKGLFRFEGEPLEGVMQTLSRWYDFTYSFERAEARQLHFTGTLKRYESVQTILMLVGHTADVKIQITKDEIIIK